MNELPTAATDARDASEPVDLSLVAANLPFVLRTFVGTAALVTAANVVGVLVVLFTTTATNTTTTPHQRTAILTSAIVIVAVQVIVGNAAGALIHRRTLRWLLRGERPAAADAARALRMKLDMALIVIALWFIGDLVVAVESALVGVPTQSVLSITGGVAIAGLASAGITYLLVGRITAPIARLALVSQPPTSAPVFGMRWRLFTIWLLTSAAPVVGIVLIVVEPQDLGHVREAIVFVGVVAILLGAMATLLTARAIGAPLRAMVRALNQVERGDLNVSVSVDDAGEIGLVQSGFNDMVEGLRERERIQDLFDRHVGSAVAAEAIRRGITLQGESREIVALFVDITGSTRLAREMDPADFVDLLNRFFEIVVEEVQRNGGLLNKFEGDAALGVFGAPVEIDDACTAALVAARQIRDRVCAVDELDVGIGVAAGPVIAGQIGTPSRLEYTVVGDAVNEAARLTEQAKRAEGRILASEATVTAAGQDEQRHWAPARVLRLRGREQPTTAYHSVADGTAPALSPGRWISEVARAVTDFPPRR